MRLSTASDRDEAAGVATIRAAIEAGATLLDTADAYALDDDDRHHNERLIARAIAPAGKDRAAVTIATKGGLVRPGGRWVPDGRASHLRAVCEASRVALGADAIDLYLLHAPDPKTPIATSVRALAQLRREGAVRRIGLSNVSLTQLREAESIATIDAIEVELSPWNDIAIRGGLVEHCTARGILLLAHTPLGGSRRARRLAKDPALSSVAKRHETSAVAVALAWLCDLAEIVVPIPGARTPEHAREVVSAQTIDLDEHDRAMLDARVPSIARLRVPESKRRPRNDADGDVVLVMGIPGAGKSEHARALVARGYERLNRDSEGGTLRALLPTLEAHLASGRRRVVLDNTYAARATRAEVIDVAWRHGVPVRCVWIDAPIEVAQANAARRMIACHEGTLPSPEAIVRRAKKDPVFLAPGAIGRVRREIEPPESDEGFRAIDVLAFERAPRPGFDRAAIFVALGAIAKIGRGHGDDDLVRFVPSAAEIIEAHRPSADAAIHVFAWAPFVVSSPGGAGVSSEELDRALARGSSALFGERAVTFSVCPHPDGRPICWCRPPMPGLVVSAIERDRIDPSRAVLLGTGPSHRAIARGVGAAYVELVQGSRAV